jgi:hypothetical protein
VNATADIQHASRGCWFQRSNYHDIGAGADVVKGEQQVGVLHLLCNSTDDAVCSRLIVQWFVPALV